MRARERRREREWERERRRETEGEWELAGTVPWERSDRDLEGNGEGG